MGGLYTKSLIKQQCDDKTVLLLLTLEHKIQKISYVMSLQYNIRIL